MVRMNLAIVLSVIFCVLSALGEELTFELPDNDKLCFYEELDTGVDVSLDFQVIEGGNFDCDVEVKDPQGKSLYKDVKKSYDTYSWKTQTKGAYELCFSNEFSTITHKLIYFHFEAGPEKPLKPGMDQYKTMTLIEQSTVSIHESLKKISEYQTHHRLRELSGRTFAEQLNERVMIRSVVEFVLILMAAICQIIVYRSFFSDKKNRGAPL